MVHFKLRQMAGVIRHHYKVKFPPFTGARQTPASPLVLVDELAPPFEHPQAYRSLGQWGGQILPLLTAD